MDELSSFCDFYEEDYYKDDLEANLNVLKTFFIERVKQRKKKILVEKINITHCKPSSAKLDRHCLSSTSTSYVDANHKQYFRDVN